MSQTWNQRKTRLRQLLHQPLQDEKGSLDDEFDQEDADGLALDRLLHGHNIIGPTTRTKEIEGLKFGDQDLNALGTLEQGQFGVIDVVSYRHNKGRKKMLYVRKTISKAFALRTRHQNSPTTERHLLLLAHRTSTPWAPHLIAAFHTPTHLSLMIPYAPLGSLWDLLSSSPLSPMRIREDELKWWIPQVICAISWCHDQGYAHRDVKPHNFVVTEEKRLMILDFGSAAPVERLGEGNRRLLSKEHCQVPVGTCDYVSPEILKAHEAALVRLELEEEEEDTSSRQASRSGSTRGSLRRMPSSAALVRKEDEVYGIETDWWSMGAMLYELVYGTAPFFADEIGRTYLKIIDFKRSLRFDPSMDEEVSAELKDLLKRILTDAEFRLGSQRGSEEFQEHRWFKGVNWDGLHQAPPPEVLHLPQFIYADRDHDTSTGGGDFDELAKSHSSHSQGFGFSAFFQSSYTTVPTRNSFSAADQLGDHDPEAEDDPVGVTPMQDRKRTLAWSSPGLSVLHSRSRSVSAIDNPATAWIGFSWGPKIDAFLATSEAPDDVPAEMTMATPKSQRSSKMFLSPTPMSIPMSTPTNNSAKRHYGTPFRTPAPVATPGTFRTPFRTPYQTQTLPAFGHGGGTAGFYTPNPRLATPGPGGMATMTGTVRRRPLSDRQAMAKLVDCVGMSARKRVEESGRKCRILNAGYTPASIGVGKGVTTGKSGFDLKRFASGVDFASSPAGEGDVQEEPERAAPTTGSRKSTSGKKLRFAFELDGAGKDKSNYAEYSSLAYIDIHAPPVVTRGRSKERSEEDDTDAELFFQSSPSQTRSQISRHSRSRSLSHSFSLEQLGESGPDTEGDTDLETTTTTSVPPSPSPSPRPGSAASGTLLSGAGGLSGAGWGGYGRSGTPTLTMTFFGKGGREKALPAFAPTRRRSTGSQSQPDETMTTTAAEQLGGSTSSAASYTSTLDAPLDEMGEKHARIMKEIERLEEKLKGIMEG